MFDWIPLPIYTLVHYIVLLIFALIVLFSLYSFRTESKSKNFGFVFFAFIMLIYIITYMGTRPLSGRYFGDMGMYNHLFKLIQNDVDFIFVGREPVWDTYMQFCGNVMDNKGFFLTTTILYVLPLYFVSIKFGGRNSYILFFLFIASFSFWGYGTNGIRNGLATSIFMLVFCTRNTLLRVFIVIIAFNIHKSMALPAAAFFLSGYLKSPKMIAGVWIAAILLSVSLGNSIQLLFSGLVEDERSSYLSGGGITESNIEHNTFRWDFLLYSSSAVFAGFYYIFKKNYSDKVYYLIWATFTMTNAVWILVIRAAFSNRFAYLSWFMMALVIVYPLLKSNVLIEQKRIVGYIVALYFGFTFFMTVILG